ncbi:MAG: type fimbrial biosis protein FimT [Shewanella sp.]|jgi:type IV fimbrial biogenesis protein FimT|uniref:GspH/FimT family pseudopilin n=1 Tax=Shewanella TaxID=22 RepID=UPI001677207B|nr:MULTISPECIES: GspH/FimT family pseudopilin [Shewanella]MBO1271508.1 GspH/FimT family pseudopilin [Shewanella sp. 4t3-1-2LB]MCL2905752.1 GspH/FimT family pseudopilin [Shewanella fodinae]MDN5369036.1 type fimbrial biosis protein FimT [Shewanella sp.]GGY97187.1 type IV minor pilin protein FimT [Shewanella fodinae]
MKRQVYSGFTLVELIITLLVFTILLGIAVPSLADLQRQYRTDSAIRQLQQLLAFARNQAISYRSRVTVCHLEDNRCQDGNWQPGISIFIDRNGNQQLDSDERLLLESGPFHSQDSIFYNRATVRFLADGLASGSNGTLSYCPDKTVEDGQSIVVNQAGRTRRSTDNVKCDD